MSFGRAEKGGKACTVLNIDSDVPKSVLEQIRKAKNIEEVKLVKL